MFLSEESNVLATPTSDQEITITRSCEIIFVKAVFLQRTPSSDQQNNNHKLMFNAILYLRMTLNSPEEQPEMNSLVEAVSALVMTR